MLYQWPPPGRVLITRGDGRYQITAPADTGAEREWLPLPDTGASEDTVRPVPHASLALTWRNQGAARCRPLLDQAGGMDQVQQYLAGIGVEALDATLITKDLLGDGAWSLGEAKRIVLSHPARASELAWHEDLMDNLGSLTGNADDPDNPASRQITRRTFTPESDPRTIPIMERERL